MTNCILCDRQTNFATIHEQYYYRHDDVCARCYYVLITRANLVTKDFIRSTIYAYDGEIFMSRINFDAWIYLGEILYGKTL